MASPVLGIDLGTTNSVVAVSDGRSVRVLEDADGHVLTPSTVSFHPNGEVLVGRAARERRLVDAANTMFSIKRLIGRPFRSPEVRRAQERFPFKFVEGATGGVMVESRGDAYSLPEISAFVLRRMRAIAERALGQSCVNAVITVPANFNELQRTATRDAGSIAGLNVLRILNEPTAAALAYGVRSSGAKERIAVYDFGGGTFDVSILELAGDVFEVVATAGDTYLGGDDVDALIADRMVQSFLEQHRQDLSTDRQTYERLRLAAEWVKCQLSLQGTVTAKVEEIAYGPGGAPLSLKFDLGRPALDQMLQPLVARTFDICEDAMRIAGVRPTQLDGVVLVGGSTRIPLVRKMVTEYFGKEPLTSVDPDLVVAQGAAIQGFALSGAKPKSPFKSTLRDGGSVVATRPVATLDTTQSFETDTTVVRQAPTAQVPPPPPESMRPVPSGTLPPPVPGKRPSVGLTTLRTGTLPPPGPQRPVVEDIFETMATDVTGPPAADDDDGPVLTMEAHDGPDTDSPELVAISNPDASWDEPDLLAPRAPKELGALPPRLAKMDLKRKAPPPPAAGPPPARPPAAAAPPPPANQEPEDEVSFASVHPEPMESDLPPALGRPNVHVSSVPPPLTRASQPAQPPQSVRAPQQAPSVKPSAPSEPAPAFRSPLLLDVTPHTLVVETAGGFCEAVIHRNSPIPTEQTRVFSTSQDNQADVRVRVAQGEERKVTDNQELGVLELTGLRPAPRGQVTITVTFILDANGTLSVKAKDTSTGREQTIRINLQGGLSSSEVDRMRQRQASMYGGV